MLMTCDVRTQTATSFVSSLAYFPVSCVILHQSRSASTLTSSGRRSLYLPTYTTSLASPLSANIVVAAFNLSSSIGSTVTGYVSDLSVEWTIAVMGVCGAVLALTAWGLASSLGAVFAFAVLFSLFSQSCSCVALLMHSFLSRLFLTVALDEQLLGGRST